MKTHTMDLFSIVIQILPSIIAGGIGYLIARKKNEAEVRRFNVETDSLGIGNMHRVTTIWQSLTNDLRKEVEYLREQNSELKLEIEELRELFQKQNRQA